MKLEFVFLLNLLKLFYTSSVWVELSGSMLCRERFFFTNQQQKHEKKTYGTKHSKRKSCIFYCQLFPCFNTGSEKKNNITNNHTVAPPSSVDSTQDHDRNAGERYPYFSKGMHFKAWLQKVLTHQRPLLTDTDIALLSNNGCQQLHNIKETEVSGQWSDQIIYNIWTAASLPG